ncbi:MAG: fibronectin type III domain-containing protein [Ruminiclostridium sp.]|nr:fibronectin type III domain-containing protein [Ruminiclostridium sp.]
MPHRSCFGLILHTAAGKAQKPAVTIKDGDKTLKKGTDYTVSYKNNTNIGTASATIKGKGDYTGTKTVKFSIVPPATTLTAEKGDGKFKLSWKAVNGITKYQIQYSTDGGKTFESAGKAANTKTSSSLKLDTSKTCTFRIRSYKTVDGKKYYSEWSKAVTVK